MTVAAAGVEPPALNSLAAVNVSLKPNATAFDGKSGGANPGFIGLGIIGPGFIGRGITIGAGRIGRLAIA